MLDPTVVPLKNMEGTTWWQKAKAIIGPGFVVGKQLVGIDRIDDDPLLLVLLTLNEMYCTRICSYRLS